MPKCGFIKVALQLYWVALWYGFSPVNLQEIFRTSFDKNTYGGLLLSFSGKQKIISWDDNYLASGLLYY